MVPGYCLGQSELPNERETSFKRCRPTGDERTRCQVIERDFASGINSDSAPQGMGTLLSVSRVITLPYRGVSVNSISIKK
jgi:hypothetical protein